MVDEFVWSLVWGIVFMAIGLLFMAGVAFRWKWFTELPKVKRAYEASGKTGATVHYIIIGLIGVVVGAITVLRAILSGQ